MCQGTRALLRLWEAGSLEHRGLGRFQGSGQLRLWASTPCQQPHLLTSKGGAGSGWNVGPHPISQMGAWRPARLQARLEQGQAWNLGLSAAPAASYQHLFSPLSCLFLSLYPHLGPMSILCSPVSASSSTSLLSSIHPDLMTSRTLPFSALTLPLHHVHPPTLASTSCQRAPVPILTFSVYPAGHPFPLCYAFHPPSITSLLSLLSHPWPGGLSTPAHLSPIHTNHLLPVHTTGNLTNPPRHPILFTSSHPRPSIAALAEFLPTSRAPPWPHQPPSRDPLCRR